MVKAKKTAKAATEVQSTLEGFGLSQKQVDVYEQVVSFAFTPSEADKRLFESAPKEIRDQVECLLCNVRFRRRGKLFVNATTRDRGTYNDIMVYLLKSGEVKAFPVTSRTGDNGEVTTARLGPEQCSSVNVYKLIVNDGLEAISNRIDADWKNGKEFAQKLAETLKSEGKESSSGSIVLGIKRKHLHEGKALLKDILDNVETLKNGHGFDIVDI
jgi:hypothetical protein